MIISVDFDGTCVKHEFPAIGPVLPGAISTMKELVRAGHKIILNTCREDDRRLIYKRYLTNAIEWFKKNNIPLHNVNENCREDDSFRDGCDQRRKIYAGCYIDDRNLGGFCGWKAVAEHFHLPYKEE